jgi:N-methylhydantoinase A
MAALERAFHQAHERRYGHASEGAVEIVSFRLAAIGAVPKPPPARWVRELQDAPARAQRAASEVSPRESVAGTLAAARRTERAVRFGGESTMIAVYERPRLPGGVPLAGPAVVEEMGATTVIPPGWTGTVGPWGELVLERRSL